MKGQIKTVSNIVCEYIITSDHDYFERIGEEETKEVLKNMKLELPDVPNISDININRLSRKEMKKF